MIRIDLNVFEESINPRETIGGKGSRRTTRGEIHPTRYVPQRGRRKKERIGRLLLFRSQKANSAGISGLGSINIYEHPVYGDQISVLIGGLYRVRGASWQNRDVTRQPVQTEVCIFRGTVVAILSFRLFLFFNLPIIHSSVNTKVVVGIFEESRNFPLSWWHLGFDVLEQFNERNICVQLLRMMIKNDSLFFFFFFS